MYKVVFSALLWSGSLWEQNSNCQKNSPIIETYVELPHVIRLAASIMAERALFDHHLAARQLELHGALVQKRDDISLFEHMVLGHEGATLSVSLGGCWREP